MAYSRDSFYLQVSLQIASKRPAPFISRETLWTAASMKILNILDKRSILPDLASRTKEGVLQEMVHSLAQVQKQIHEDRLMEILVERESLGSTAIGEGVALPHGKTNEVNKILTSFGRSLSGMDFQSLDGKPTHLFFLLVLPKIRPGCISKPWPRSPT